MLYRIFRQGTFKCKLVPESQCGVLGQDTFQFAVTIEVDRLNADGFVCDNFDVPQAFQRKFGAGMWRASCEALAGGGVYLMRHLCSIGGVDRARKITCRIQPIADAWVEVEWKAGEPMPSAYPLLESRITGSYREPPKTVEPNDPLPPGRQAVQKRKGKKKSV